MREAKSPNLELILYFLFIREVLSAQLDEWKNVKLGHEKVTERDLSPGVNIYEHTTTMDLIHTLKESGIACSHNLNNITK